MRAREQLRGWLDSQLGVYKALLEMGGPRGDQSFDYSPVLPLLDELRREAPQPLAEELGAARAFLGERFPPPWKSHEADPVTKMAERDAFRLIVQWLNATGDLAAEIPPTTITYDAKI